MFTKDSLKKQFAKDWKKHYELEIFKEKGFVRRECPKCGKNFWTLDSERKLCGDSSCENYGFIEKPIARQKWDYIQTWKEFESFFRKNGHASILRYPVIDRWRPDLFFTIASIQDFQRLDQGNMVFEYPANPLVVPQMCLRFNDIPNVGVTGRHHTSFIMSGQHAFGFPKEGYFKDRCIELNFKFLNSTMGIPEKELTYIEDMWTMPDFSAFGPSMETFSRGLELVNSVFMQFTKAGDGYKDLPIKVIDVGWGHERLVWFSQGTHTGYEAVYGPVIKELKKKAGLTDSELFNRYSVIAGSLNIDEAADVKKVREDIAKRLGVTVKELNQTVEPLQALYAIADHAQTLLFATADGGIPSNVGGGYNLRVLLRRALSFLSEFGFDFTLDKVAELHAARLRPLFPELKEGLKPLSDILAVEKERYENTLQKTGIIVEKELKKGRISVQDMIKLYVSNGITPELIEKAARKKGLELPVPENFYTELTASHMAGRKEEEGEEELKADVSGIPETGKLYYEDRYRKEFTAKVLRASGSWVILDRTIFYPESGGQPADLGSLSINGKAYRVADVKKVGEVILHRLESQPKLSQGQEVSGQIDWERRHQLMKMHTCTHILAGATRKVIGRHVWQAGAQKGIESSRLDVTHYRPFTQDETRQIETLVNDTIKKNLRVESVELPRSQAEGKYGFVLYQGGASPGKKVRVVSVEGGFDVEACGGTHLRSTGEIGRMKIIKAERIQDGVNRIEFTCGEKAADFEKGQKSVFLEAVERMKGIEAFRDAAQGVQASEIGRELRSASQAFSVEPEMLPRTIERFGREIQENQEEIDRMREKLGQKKVQLRQEESIKQILSRPGRSLGSLSEAVFSVWKEQAKIIQRLGSDLAKSEGKRLAEKARGDHIYEMIPAERKMLIEIANEIVASNPGLTVVLANQAGEVIGMSRKRNAGKMIREICQKAGGSGGGSPVLGQGKAEISKLSRTMEELRSRS